MNDLLKLLATSFVLCLVFTPFLRRVALRCEPDDCLEEMPSGVIYLFSLPVTFGCALSRMDGCWTSSMPPFM